MRIFFDIFSRFSYLIQQKHTHAKEEEEEGDDESVVLTLTNFVRKRENTKPILVKQEEKKRGKIQTSLTN